MLCNEVPLVFSGELYATTSWSGALLLVALSESGFRRGSRCSPAAARCWSCAHDDTLPLGTADLSARR